MHRDVEIYIECPITDVQRAKDFLILNKLVYVKDIVQTPTAAPETVLLSIPATVFDEPDVQILEQTLKAANIGVVEVKPEKIRIFTQTTILSGLLVAAIVTVALFVHNFNEDFYDKVFLHHDIFTLVKTAIIITGSAAAGFFLEMLIIYRDRKNPSHH
jgi:hypothetical protein